MDATSIACSVDAMRSYIPALIISSNETVGFSCCCLFLAILVRVRSRSIGAIVFEEKRKGRREVVGRIKSWTLLVYANRTCMCRASTPDLTTIKSSDPQHHRHLPAPTLPSASTGFRSYINIGTLFHFESLRGIESLLVYEDYLTD